MQLSLVEVNQALIAWSFRRFLITCKTRPEFDFDDPRNVDLDWHIR